jgi:uncharacterized protein YidB (DUF937 family)
MGLLDILHGMQNGPHGQSTPNANEGGGGMSPLTIALLGLLAYKAVKHFNPGQAGAANEPANTGSSDGGGLAGGLGGLLQGGLGNMLQGGLGGLLQGPLGGLLAGGAAGGALSGGLNDLLKQFQQKGLGDAAQSWVDNGPNKSIAPDDISKVLDEDQINTLATHSGLSREELMAGLSQQLPALINHLTPLGRIPTEQEAAKLV